MRKNSGRTFPFATMVGTESVRAEAGGEARVLVALATLGFQATQERANEIAAEFAGTPTPILGMG